METHLNKEYIKGLIEERGMTKAEFAAKLGIARQNLDTLLNSQKKDIHMVIKMAEILDIPLMEFIGLEERKNTIYGCLYVNGVPKIVSSAEEILAILTEMGVSISSRPTDKKKPRG